jgi:hypothetical protein
MAVKVLGIAPNFFREVGREYIISFQTMEFYLGARVGVDGTTVGMELLAPVGGAAPTDGHCGAVANLSSGAQRTISAMFTPSPTVIVPWTFPNLPRAGIPADQPYVPGSICKYPFVLAGKLHCQPPMENSA